MPFHERSGFISVLCDSSSTQDGDFPALGILRLELESAQWVLIIWKITRKRSTTYVLLFLLVNEETAYLSFEKIFKFKTPNKTI